MAQVGVTSPTHTMKGGGESRLQNPPSPRQHSGVLVGSQIRALLGHEWAKGRNRWSLSEGSGAALKTWWAACMMSRGGVGSMLCTMKTITFIRKNQYFLLHLITSYSSYFGGKKGISGNKTSFFLLMTCGFGSHGHDWCCY